MEKNLHNTIIKIRTNGYWKIRFLSVVPLQKSPKELAEAVSKSSVHLRGWPYPFVPTSNDDHQAQYLAGNYQEGWIDWDRHKEVWRLFKDGQYIHNTAIWEDWSSEDIFTPANDSYRQIKPREVLSFIGATYTLVEIFVFLRALFESGFYEKDVDVMISLHNMQGRKLEALDPRRFSLFGNYECHIPDITLQPIRTDKDEIQRMFQSYALDLTLELFEQFQWIGPPIEVIKQDQKNLLERRL